MTKLALEALDGALRPDAAASSSRERLLEISREPRRQRASKFPTYFQGDWTVLRTLHSHTIEIDFHRVGERDGLHFEERMEAVRLETLKALEEAAKRALDAVLVTHGASTSGLGRKSSRSLVRAVLRSKDSTPFIIRGECVVALSATLFRLRASDPARVPVLACPKCGEHAHEKSQKGLFRHWSKGDRAEHLFTWLDLEPRETP